MNTVVTGEPAVEPLALPDAKTHLKIETSVTDDDALVTSLIKAARQHVEEHTHRKLIEQTLQTRFDTFPASNGAILVPWPKLMSLTSLQYIDTNGTTQTLTVTTDYVVDAYSEPARIVPAYGKNWPTTQAMINAVTLEYEAGYGAAANVPEAIVHAMKLIIGHWYQNREAVVLGTITAEVPQAARALMDHYRVKRYER